MKYVLMDIDDEDGVTEWFVHYYDTGGSEEDGTFEEVGMTFTLNKEEALSFHTYQQASDEIVRNGYSLLKVVGV